VPGDEISRRIAFQRTDGLDDLGHDASVKIGSAKLAGMATQPEICRRDRLRRIGHPAILGADR
jgi:hypothetical protein